jgi:PAS domain-containing protein
LDPLSSFDNPHMMKLSDYQALFRASPYPYLVMGPDLTIIGASSAYLRSVQRTEEDIVGRYVFEAFPENPDNPDATNISEVKASLLRALAKGEPDTTAFVRYAVPIKTPEGTRFETRAACTACAGHACDDCRRQWCSFSTSAYPT